jgi:hypothetical protein
MSSPTHCCPIIIDRIFDRAETVVFQGQNDYLKGRINLPALHARQFTDNLLFAMPRLLHV